MLILGISPPAAPFSSLPGDLGYGDGFYIDPLSDPSPQAILSEHPHQRPSSLDLAVLADDDDHVLTVSDPSPQAAPLSGLHRFPPSADERICTDCTLGAAGVRHLVAATSATSPPPPPPPSSSWGGIMAVCARVQGNQSSTIRCGGLQSRPACTWREGGVRRPDDVSLGVDVFSIVIKRLGYRFFGNLVQKYIVSWHVCLPSLAQHRCVCRVQHIYVSLKCVYSPGAHNFRQSECRYWARSVQILRSISGHCLAPYKTRGRGSASPDHLPSYWSQRDAWGGNRKLSSRHTLSTLYIISSIPRVSSRSVQRQKTLSQFGP